MTTRQTVKARLHQGAKSLDLTIPVSLCQQLGLKGGDVFVVEGTREGGKVVLHYSRIG